ncbi:MAG: EAL domain-containing protein [Nocardioides sp.]
MRITRSLLPVAVLVVAGAGGLLLVMDPGPAWLRDVVLVPMVLLLPVIALWRAVGDSPDVRPWLVPLTTGMTMFPLGTLVSAVGSVIAGPSGGFVGEVTVLVGYPFLGTALVAALAQRAPGFRLTMCLDGLTGAAAGAAVGTLVLAPLLGTIGGGQWSSVPMLAFPFFDAVLVAASLGALALVGLAHGRQFGSWALAMVMLGAVHVAQAQWSVERAEPLPWSAVGLVIALVLLVVGALGQDSARPARLPGARSLGVPTMSSIAAVAVLALSPSWDQAPWPQALALLTLLLAAARFVRAFLQLRELAAAKEMALTDELTGIPNRRALYLHLDALIALQDDEPAADDPGSFAVALIDLDHFKEVNDTLGHATGDALLKGIVGRFAEALEQLETPHLFARLGGDEFAVVLHEATTRNAAMIVGEALQDSLAEPLSLPGAMLHAHASIGLALAPRHGRTRSEILFAADAAMYAAKTSGDHVRFHAPSRDEKSQQLGLSEDLHRALVRRELCVDYQPIEDADGLLVGVEALVRWDHPERGVLPPQAFLPAAERYRLTGAIAERVLDVALGDLVRWRAAGSSLSLSVNLSPADLRDETIVQVVAGALLEHELPASVLVLDIAETTFSESPDRVREVLMALHGLGVRLALDNYGTGGTGLDILQALPFHELKLDRRYARDAAVDARSTGLVRSAVELAHALGLQIVAAGVEDRRASDKLRELGCDRLQGFHLGRPCPGTDIERLLARPTGGKHRLPVPEQGARIPLPEQGARIPAEEQRLTQQ